MRIPESVWRFPWERWPFVVSVRQSGHKGPRAQQSGGRGECELRQAQCQQPGHARDREMKQQCQSDGATDGDAEDHEKLTDQSQTLGAHFGAYSRVQYFMACSSPTIRPL